MKVISERSVDMTHNGIKAIRVDLEFVIHFFKEN